MKILSATCNANVAGYAFKRGDRYVASDNIAHSLCAAAPGVLHIVADAAVFTRPWRGEALAGKRLLVYRPLGLGDEFLTARLAAYAATSLGAGQVGFACYDSHHSLWAHTPDLPFKLFGAVLDWPTWSAAHFHVAGEHWWEALGTSDQPDVWQIFESACNIQLPASARVPLVPATPPEIVQQTHDTLAPFLQGRPLVLWQLAATSRIRSYPPEQTRAAMRLLIEKSNVCIVAAGHPSQVAEYGIEESDRISIYSAGIPGLLALLATRPSIVVCPDSVVGHLAATLDPAWSPQVVSLWSSFDPRVRVASYRNHHPIFNRIKCSPCWTHECHTNPDQYQGCPHTACNDYCAGLRNIAPTQVVEAVLACLAASSSPVEASAHV